jgi:hypothetical protein
LASNINSLITLICLGFSLPQDDGLSSHGYSNDYPGNFSIHNGPLIDSSGLSFSSPF